MEKTIQKIDPEKQEQRLKAIQAVANYKRMGA